MTYDPKEAEEGYIAVLSSRPLGNCVGIDGKICCFHEMCLIGKYPDVSCMKSKRKDKSYVTFQECDEDVGSIADKRTYTDKMHGWMVKHICDTMIAGRNAMSKLRVLGSSYEYCVACDVFDSDRFEEVE